jgi:hypothetical protein
MNTEGSINKPMTAFEEQYPEMQRKIEKLERDNIALTVCLNHAMDTIKNPDRGPTEKLASLLRGLATALKDNSGE